MNRSAWPVAVVLTLVLAGIGLRVAAALRPGLWGDEIFSLAMATGHSLEHPPAIASPSLGDFVEPRRAESPSAFRRYIEHDDPPAGGRRVVRAVLLSDTGPPLYYLLLNGWTRVFGTSDATLRLFSVWCAVLTLPLLWLLARELGQRRMAWSACLLFCFSVAAIYYSAEGRMYALLWVLAAGLAWPTLRLPRTRAPRWVAALWVLAGAAGLLTHYFFAFVWLACLMWLWAFGGSASRRRVALLAGLTVLAVSPWYIQVPTSLAQWRVTAGWQDGSLVWPQDLARPLVLAAGMLSGMGPAGGWRWADPFVAGLFVLLAVWIWRQGLMRRVFGRRSLLLWMWVSASCLGVLAFDLLRHTTTSYVPRYVLPGLPAATLLAALLLSRLPPKPHRAALGAILLVWVPGAWAAATGAPRPQHPFRDLDARLESWARPGDLVLVHSVPTGVIGVARYLQSDIPLASWVVQLGLRQVPGDLELLLAGRRRVALVKVHYRGVPAPAEAWLQAHARLAGRETFPRSSAQLLHFEAVGGGPFFPGPAPDGPTPASGP